MGKAKVKLNLKGVNEIMKSEGVKSELQRRADAIANAANSNSQNGGTYKARSRTGRFIALADVKTADFEACLDNSNNNTLLKAMDAGRR